MFCVTIKRWQYYFLLFIAGNICPLITPLPETLPLFGWEVSISYGRNHSGLWPLPLPTFTEHIKAGT